MVEHRVRVRFPPPTKSFFSQGIPLSVSYVPHIQAVSIIYHVICTLYVEIMSDQKKVLASGRTTFPMQYRFIVFWKFSLDALLDQRTTVQISESMKTCSTFFGFSFSFDILVCCPTLKSILALKLHSTFHYVPGTSCQNPLRTTEFTS